MAQVGGGPGPGAGGGAGGGGGTGPYFEGSKNYSYDASANPGAQMLNKLRLGFLSMNLRGEDICIEKISEKEDVKGLKKLKSILTKECDKLHLDFMVRQKISERIENVDKVTHEKKYYTNTTNPEELGPVAREKVRTGGTGPNYRIGLRPDTATGTAPVPDVFAQSKNVYDSRTGTPEFEINMNNIDTFFVLVNNILYTSKSVTNIKILLEKSFKLGSKNYELKNEFTFNEFEIGLNKYFSCLLIYQKKDKNSTNFEFKKRDSYKDFFIFAETLKLTVKEKEKKSYSFSYDINFVSRFDKIFLNMEKEIYKMKDILLTNLSINAFTHALIRDSISTSELGILVGSLNSYVVVEKNTIDRFSDEEKMKEYFFKTTDATRIYQEIRDNYPFINIFDESKILYPSWHIKSSCNIYPSSLDEFYLERTGADSTLEKCFTSFFTSDTFKTAKTDIINLKKENVYILLFDNNTKVVTTFLMEEFMKRNNLFILNEKDNGVIFTRNMENITNVKGISLNRVRFDELTAAAPAKTLDLSKE